MNRDESFRIDWLCGQYLAALEELNFDAMDKFWEMAASDPDLEQAFHQLHDGLLEEEQEQLRSEIKQVVQEQLPSAQVIEPPQQLTVADVMACWPNDVRYQNHTEWNGLLTAMRQSTEPMPSEVAASKLEAWATQQFGTGPKLFWQAFHRATMLARMRVNSTTHYSLAARPAPKREG